MNIHIKIWKDPEDPYVWRNDENGNKIEKIGFKFEPESKLLDFESINDYIELQKLMKLNVYFIMTQIKDVQTNGKGKIINGTIIMEAVERW